MGFSLNTVLKLWRERILREIKVSLPGYITVYNSDTRLADVQLTIKPEINDEFADPPLLLGVPVRQYNSQAVIYYAPPAKDDLVDVMFADYSIAENQQEDGLTIVEPSDTEKHVINNAYAVLRGQTSKNKRSVDDPTLPGIYLDDDSKLFLGRLGGGGEEVLNLLHQTADALAELTDFVRTKITFTNTPANPLGPTGPPDTAPLLVPLEAKLDQIKTGLESLGEIEPPLP